MSQLAFGGTTVVSATIVEKVRFAQQRSKVFNNAYFVNNYGWFQGSGCNMVEANADPEVVTSRIRRETVVFYCRPAGTLNMV